MKTVRLDPARPIAGSVIAVFKMLQELFHEMLHSLSF